MAEEIEKTEGTDGQSENQTVCPGKLSDALNTDQREVLKMEHVSVVDELIQICTEKRKLGEILPVLKLLHPAVSTIDKIVLYFTPEVIRNGVATALQILSLEPSSGALRQFQKAYFKGNLPSEIISKKAANAVVDCWCQEGDVSRAVLSSILLRGEGLTNEEIGKLTEAIKKMVMIV